MRTGHQKRQKLIKGGGHFLQGISSLAENILTDIVVPLNEIFCVVLQYQSLFLLSYRSNIYF